MKTVGELTETEALKLCFAQEHLKHCALIYSTKPDDSMRVTLLYCAAREFSELCNEIGMPEYWREKIETKWQCDV